MLLIQSIFIRVKINYFEFLINSLVVSVIFYYQQTFIPKLDNHDKNLKLFIYNLLKFVLLLINTHSSSF